tara:strand:+ start:957 stop:2087 length:1131 start_codon:yes stop_codon:yes gene_type:complete
VLISFKEKVLVAGCGLAGSTIARILAENNIKVDLIEKRSHIAGNAFDFINENNERIHKYGPHLLHCNKNSEALKFLSRFTEWIDYEHKVNALLEDGRYTTLPINQKTIEDIYKINFKNEIEVKEFLDSVRNKNLLAKNTDQLYEATVGNKLANIFFRPYSKKMWGLDPKFLDINVGARLPVRINKDARYFSDSFQALPKHGYTSMVEKMLEHENISLTLNKKFEKNMENEYEHLFLCIPIDLYFSYEYGALPYRSIIFENRYENIIDLPSAVVNFTDDSIYTRKTQWSLLPNCPNLNSSKKTITYEIPCSMEKNKDEFYYPVQTKESRRIFDLYRNLSVKNKKITFCGRTGLFKYLDMIPAVQIHMKMAYEYLKRK